MGDLINLEMTGGGLHIPSGHTRHELNYDFWSTPLIMIQLLEESGGSGPDTFVIEYIVIIMYYQ